MPTYYHGSCQPNSKGDSPGHSKDDGAPLFKGECPPTALLLFFAGSLILHLAVAVFFCSRVDVPRPAEMTVEMGAVLPAPAHVPPAARAPSNPTSSATPSVQPMVKPVPEVAKVWHPPVYVGAPRLLSGEKVPVPQGASQGTVGAPAPVPFPEQQRRVNVPYSTYSGSPYLRVTTLSF